MLGEKFYALCTQIPKGKVSTYKELGRALNTKAYQAIGQALKRNPYAPDVPCHRIVSSCGKLHGFKGKREGKELKEKRVLLEKEGVKVDKGTVDLKKYFFALKK